MISVFPCFHVLHNVRHKISTIFMMLKRYFRANLFLRLLCWSIYWWIMSFTCGFEYIVQKSPPGIYRVYFASDNALASNMRQPSIWTNDGLVYWRIYASLDLNQLKVLGNNNRDQATTNHGKAQTVRTILVMYSTFQTNFPTEYSISEFLWWCLPKNIPSSTNLRCTFTINSNWTFHTV